MKLMFHMRSVKNPWTQNTHPIYLAKSKMNLAEGPFSSRCPVSPGYGTFCYHLLTRFQRQWVTAGESAASNLVSVTPGGDR